MHHLALLLAIGVPHPLDGFRCGCAVATTAPIAPTSTVATATAPHAAVVPKYGALAAQPSTTMGPRPTLAGPGVDPPASMPNARAGIWRVAASVLRLTTRPNAAPMGGPMMRR